MIVGERDNIIDKIEKRIKTDQDDIEAYNHEKNRAEELNDEKTARYWEILINIVNRDLNDLKEKKKGLLKIK